MVHVSLSHLGLTAVGFPLFGFLFAITWSILYNWEDSCWTDCEVPNLLPTISSAIGGFTPQRYVWRICIMMQAGLRFIMTFCYYHWYLRIHMAKSQRLYANLVTFAVVCHVLENIGLIILSAISSIDNPDIHEYSFILFMVCSQIYMLMSCVLLRWTHRSGNYKPSPTDLRLLKIKTFLFVFNFVSFLIAVYFYFRHNKYCEPYVYTLFALFEYFVVLSNIAFHGLFCADFRDYSFTFLHTEDIKSGRFKNS